MQTYPLCYEQMILLCFIKKYLLLSQFCYVLNLLLKGNCSTYLHIPVNSALGSVGGVRVFATSITLLKYFKLFTPEAKNEKELHREHIRAFMVIHSGLCHVFGSIQFV